MKKILITGGAGFIGSNLASVLINEGYSITIYDSFSNQIHGEVNKLNNQLSKSVNLIKADVRDKKELYKALRKTDILIHLAAETGTGQSMYDISKYTDVNIQGTSLICEFLLNESHTIENVIVASSRAIYGEGQYVDKHQKIYHPNSQEVAINNELGISATATSEDCKKNPLSFYGITKQVQEEMILMATKLLQITGVALRYQNVYGPGQSLKNPYTGIISIFSQLALQDKTINVFEDGKQSRDFVFIDDVTSLTARCIKLPKGTNLALNVGTGIPTTVHDVAKAIKLKLNSKSKIIITGEHRKGDIRHNYADLRLLKEILGAEPEVNFNEGLNRFIEWVKGNGVVLSTNDYDKSISELKTRGLYGE